MSQEPLEPEAPRRPHSIILRPWPKVIFFFPTMLAALIVGTLQFLEGLEMGDENYGLAFFAILAFNLLVITFEFSRLKSLSIFFLLLAAFFLFLYLGTKFPVLQFLRDAISSLHIRASTSFYFCLGAFMGLIFFLVFINTRWNYYEVRHNEIVHHTGFLGDIKRLPSPSLKITKEITDVVEFLLLGAGRIILYPAMERRAIVLDNVFNVNRAEKDLETLLSSLQVVEVQQNQQFQGD